MGFASQGSQQYGLCDQADTSRAMRKPVSTPRPAGVHQAHFPLPFFGDASLKKVRRDQMRNYNEQLLIKESDEPKRNECKASETEIHNNRLNFPPLWEGDSESKPDSSHNSK